MNLEAEQHMRVIGQEDSIGAVPDTMEIIFIHNQIIPYVMPRGRPKGSKNLNSYERGKVKRIRETLAQKGITDFDNLRDPQILHNIYLETDGEIFVNYEIFKNPSAGKAVKKSRPWEEILNKMEKNLAALREVL
jgi:hypothetical protein